MNFGLSGKTALAMNASTGIGTAVAPLLAREEVRRHSRAARPHHERHLYGDWRTLLRFDARRLGGR